MDIKAILTSKTVAELRTLAAQRHITGRSTMKKTELVDALIVADVELLLAIDEITPEQEEAFAAAVSASRKSADDEADEIEAALQRDADAGTYSFTNEVAILRDAPGRAIVTAAFDGRTVGGSIVRTGRRYMLTAGTITIKANSLGKLAKLFAKRLGFRADVIDIGTVVC